MSTITAIDVSHHNGLIKWDVLSKGPFKPEFVYIKVSEGVGYMDPTVQRNAEQAKQFGFKIGYYHFASLNNEDVIADAKAEVQWFLKCLRKLPMPDMPYVLDVESNKKKIPPVSVLVWIKTFFNELVKSGREEVVLYSYTPFLNENLPATHDLGDIKLWIADYTPPLKLPVGWNKAWLWQYSQSGKLQGIIGNVDLNMVPLP